MFLKRIEIKNLRCLSVYKENFSSGINLIYGENGAGKTTILEAMHILSVSKSFRSGNQAGIQRTKTTTMSIIGDIEGKKKEKIEYYRQLNKKNIIINKEKIKKLSNIIGVLPCVVLSPEDIDVVSGGNKARQTQINKILSQTSPNYLVLITKYNKILKIRNKCLTDNRPYKEIEVWDQQLIPLAKKIWKERGVFFENFIDIFKNLTETFIPNQEALIKYKPQGKGARAALAKDLFEKLEKDRTRKQTSIGPHKDIIDFQLQGIDIKNQASQGEKKLFLAILKAAEAKYIYKETKKRPILLLDDLFSKLDQKKGKTILEMIDNKHQTFITTTDSAVNPYFSNFNSINFMKLEKSKETCLGI